MRPLFTLSVLAFATRSALAQQPTAPPAPQSDTVVRHDTAGVAIGVHARLFPSLADTSSMVRQLSARRAAPEALGPGREADTAMTDTLRLTRDQAVAQALARNPQLEVARQQTAEARAQRVQDVAIPDPVGSASITNQAGSPSYKPVGASLTVPFPDKFRLQYNIGTAGVRTAQYNYAALRQQIGAQTAQTYDSLRVALRHRADLTESRALSADFLQKTQARYNAGTAPKLDVVRAQVNVGQADNALLANALSIATARASLNRLIGRPLPSPIAPADTLVVPPPLPDLAPLEAHALAERPELAGLRAQQAGARASTTLAAEFWVPDLFFGITKDYGAPDPYIPNQNITWQYGLSVPLPVFFFEHTSGDIAQARHRERELAASFRDLRAQVDQDVRAAYATAATALQQVVYLRDQVLPAAREEYRIASISYGLGGSSALDVIQARTDLVSAESQYTDALSAADAAQADLERAAATLLTQLRTGDQHEK
jgi:outer membrane protein TolC